MTELTNVADAVEYRCGQCGEPVAMAQLWVDDEGRPYHITDDPSRWAAQLHLHVRSGTARPADARKAPIESAEGSWRSVFVQLHEDDHSAPDVWCWRCGVHFTVDIGECRREVAMAATSPSERAVKTRRLKKVSPRR